MRKKRIKLSLLLCAIQLFLVGISAQTEQKAELVVQTGHTDGIKTLPLSPNGELLASGGWDNVVKLWEKKTGREIKTFSGHYNSVNAVVFSASGKYLVSGSADTTVIIWDVETGQIKKEFDSSPINSVAISPDEKLVACGGYGGFSVWDINTETEINNTKGPSNI